MRPTTERLFLPFALAAVMCALNALKPLTIDDTAYLAITRQITAHPADPYGFLLQWYDQPEPASQILLPPVLPYWLALGMRLFGENVFLVRLWMFPFCLALTMGTHLLGQRFARGAEGILVALTAFSPIYLPGLNLMLDVPALGLGLLSLDAFFRACEDDRLGRGVGWAALAGLLAGLSMQTKYSGAVFPVLIGVAALTHRRFGRGLAFAGLACLLAAAIFLLWEWYTHMQYGESHFMHHYEEAKKPWTNRGKDKLILPFFSMLGGLVMPVALLGLTANRARLVLVPLAGGLFILGLIGVAYLPDQSRVWLEAERLNDSGQLVRHERLGIVTLHDGLAGATVVGMLAVAVCVLIGERFRPRRRRWWAWWPHRVDVFLIVWLVIEIAAYFALSPFPAARRVTGLAAVSTLLIGRYAVRSWRRTELMGVCSPWIDVRADAWQGRAVLPGLRVAVVAFGVALGMVYFVVDWRDAEVERIGAMEAVAWARANAEPGQRVWYVGHWGFQYYAERAGALPVIPDHPRLEVANVTRFREGDLIVQPDRLVDQQAILWEDDFRFVENEFEYDDPLPFRTVWVYYAGRTPIERRVGVRLMVRVYRVTQGFRAWDAD